MFNNFFSCVWPLFRWKRFECLLLGKGVLKICSKFAEEHPCRSEISKKLLCKFLEITLRYGCSPVTLLHIFRAPFLKNTSGWLLVKSIMVVCLVHYCIKLYSDILQQNGLVIEINWYMKVLANSLLAEVLQNSVNHLQWYVFPIALNQIFKSILNSLDW